MGTTPMGVGNSTNNKPKPKSSDECKSDPDCKLDGKVDTNRLWNGRCDRWHRQDCQPWPNPEPSVFGDLIAPMLQYVDQTIQVLQNADKWELFLKIGLKDISLAGRAINPLPAWDFVIGAVTQALLDIDNPNLSTGQKIGRSLVVGLESVLTSYVSDLAGVGTFTIGEAIVPEGGGIIAAPLGTVLTSLYMDGVVWNNFNQQKFENWGLGAFP